MNKYSLENKTALVTGGGGLLALQHANAILKKKGNLILVDIDKAKLARNIKVLKSHFKEIFIFCLWHYKRKKF